MVYEAGKGNSEAGRLCWRLDIGGIGEQSEQERGWEEWKSGQRDLEFLQCSESRGVASYLYATPSEKDKSVN